VIFLGEFSHCGYKSFLKNLGKFVSIVWIGEKNAQKMEKNGQSLQTAKLRKKRKKERKRKHWYRGIYVHSKWIMEKHVVKLRVTLDEGPRPRDRWIQAILFVKSFKLVPRPLDKGPRPKSGKLRLIWHRFWSGNQVVQTCAPTLIHSPSWMRPFSHSNSKTHQRNVKFELRHPYLV
jgi:hypothetical protein